MRKHGQVGCNTRACPHHPKVQFGSSWEVVCMKVARDQRLDKAASTSTEHSDSRRGDTVGDANHIKLQSSILSSDDGHGSKGVFPVVLIQNSNSKKLPRVPFQRIDIPIWSYPYTVQTVWQLFEINDNRIVFQGRHGIKNSK